MKILYDHQIFTAQKYGGISRYFYELINNFENIENIETSTSLLLSNNYYISDIPYIKHFKFFPNKEFKGKETLIRFFNRKFSIHQLKMQDYDIFHPTYYDPYFIDYIGDKPFVLTVYDMINEKFSDLFPSKNKTSQYKKLLVQKASRVIAISESTKKDLMELFGTEESKIDVVYLGNSMVLNDQYILEMEIPDKYILFVGSRELYKNFDRFIKGIAPLLQRDNELSIVCAGGRPFTSSELNLFKSFDIENQIVQFDVNDNTLALFYKKAYLFVFPSLYEGFGIPILESFACGCPLVCSNTSSLPEIAANGAEYFDPYNENSIEKAIQNVLENKALREQLITNGNQRLNEFSWEKTAQKTKKVYESILS